MAGKLFKMIVKHRKTGKAYMRYFKTRKGFNAAKGAGGTVAAAAKKTVATVKQAAPTAAKFESWTLGETRRELKFVKRKLQKTPTDALAQRVKDLQQAVTRKAFQAPPKRAALPRKKKSRYDKGFGFAGVPKPNIRRSLR
jgi:hypothetical protein